MTNCIRGYDTDPCGDIRCETCPHWDHDNGQLCGADCPACRTGTLMATSRTHTTTPPRIVYTCSACHAITDGQVHGRQMLVARR